MRKETKEVIEIVSLGQYEALEKFLSHRDKLDVKAIINDLDDFGNCAVVIAAQRNDERIFKLLDKYGADVNLPDSRGSTALMWAKEYDNRTILDLIDGSQPIPKVETHSVRFFYQNTPAKVAKSDKPQSSPSASKAEPGEADYSGPKKEPLK